MKIYFAGSIRGGRDDQELYFSIINELGNYGQVLTEHIGKKELTNVGDVVVAEVTTPSLGVGYELGLAESLNKKIVCLFRKTGDKKLSAMVSGNGYMEVCKYNTIEDIVDIFSKHLI
jgi:2'-deoxynucleoside 5'-phosphate N-hydrolase